MAIHLTTLGGLRAVRDGVELERLVGKRLRAALLVYVAVERRVARELLTTVFWPESSTDNARHALRQCIYQLRSELGEDWLEVRALELRAGATLQTDVQDFASALELGKPEQAARLYHGAFLAGVNLINLQPWENWVENKRAHHARAFRKACRDWVDAQRANGDLHGAIEAAQHWIVPDPLDDEAQHRLIAALAEAGERTAAIRRYEAYERLLKAEDLRVLDETTALIERIRSEQTAPPITLSTAAGAPDEPKRSSTPAWAPQTPVTRRMRVPKTRVGRLAAAAAALTLLVAAVMLVANGRQAPLQQSGSPADLAVLPFSVRGGHDAAWLGDGMVNLLATALDGASVRPADARSVFATVAQDGGRTPGVEQGSRVAARLGASLFVLGDVIEVGNQLRIVAAVYRAGGAAKPVSRRAVSGTSEHVFQLVDSLAAQMLADLGAPPRDRLTRTAAVTTASLAAFKEYLQGEAELRAGRFERAEEAYLRAVAHDSTFAIAHYRLALTRDWAARGGSEEAARAAARHAERLTSRDRALLEALQAYTAGTPDMERRYRAILARYPDDLEAWLQLGEVLFHYGPVQGRSTAESEQAWRRVLAYEPRNLSAILHVARIAAAAGRGAALDSLLEPFSAAEQLTDRRLAQVAVLRATAQGDTSTQRSLVQGVRSWEDAAVWQFAAYLTAFTHAPAEARRVLQGLIDEQRAPGMNADLRWFTALLHLQNGQLAAASRALADARASYETMAIAKHSCFQQVYRTGWPCPAPTSAHWQRQAFDQATTWWMATLPLPYSDSMLERIRHGASSARSRRSTDSPRAAGDALWFFLVHQALSRPGRLEALRLYTVGVLSLRLRDGNEARKASAGLARLVASDESDWFARAFDTELRARIAWHEGRPKQALEILEHQKFDAVSVGSTMVVPFMANAHARYLRGELLLALGRYHEALSWFESLGTLSLPESAFRGPAHLRLAEIHERLGNRTEAARHYTRLLELWKDSDPELQPRVRVARQRLAALPHPNTR